MGILRSEVESLPFLMHMLFLFFLAEDGFQTLQRDFMEKNYKHFEDTEENKFIYSDIHKEYVSMHFCFVFVFVLFF